MAQPYPFLDQLNLNPDVRFRLSQSLDRVNRGNTDVYLVPNTDPEAMLRGWDNIYRKHVDMLDSELVELETSNRSSFGPRSLAMPWEMRKSGVELSYAPDTLTQGPEFNTLRGDLRHVNVITASKQLKNDTSSGLPDLKHKGVVKERAVEDFQELILREDPCVMYSRTQNYLPKEKWSKTRLVWGYPIADTLQEMMVYQPLLLQAKRWPFRSALLGPESVDRAVSRLVRNAMANGEHIVSIDFNSYDAYLKRVLQDAVREFVLGLFQQASHTLINTIFDRLGTIGLVTPEKIYTGYHGVPSGSVFTNEVDSLAQYLVVQGLDLEGQIQGDDGLYRTKDPEALLQRFDDYNLDLNREKSYTSNRFAVYLQRYYSPTYVSSGELVGVMPTYRVLNRLVHPERYTDFESYGLRGNDYFSIRAIALLENCKYHPLHRQLVEFAVRNDKYKLNVTEKGLKLYVKMMSESSGSQGLIINQFGDNVKGLRDFETYKIIKTL